MAQLTQDWIVVIVALIVSILLAFVPNLNAWWESHDRHWRARIVVLICFVLALVAFVLACFGILVGSDAACPDWSSPVAILAALYAILKIALLAAGALQTVYQYGLKPTADWLAALGRSPKG